MEIVQATPANFGDFFFILDQRGVVAKWRSKIRLR